MTQNELIYIRTIAKYESLSAAAKELYISQPSLSQTLKKIEGDVGYLIFHRTSDGLKITEAGAQFVKTAGFILDRYKKLLVELDQFHQLYRGTLTLGIPINLGTYLLPAIIPQFEAMYPKITIRIEEHNSTVLNDMLLNGKTDFNIMHDQTRHESISYEPLLSDPFYLVIPDGIKQRYQFSPGQVLDQNDLKKLDHQPFVMVAKRQKLRLVADSIIKNADITPDIRYVSKSMETAKRLVAGGCGVTFLPYSYLNLFSGTEHLSCYPLDSALKASWQLVIATAVANPLSRCSLEFVRVLKHTILSAAI